MTAVLPIHSNLQQRMRTLGERRLIAKVWLHSYTCSIVSIGEQTTWAHLKSALRGYNVTNALKTEGNDRGERGAVAFSPFVNIICTVHYLLCAMAKLKWYSAPNILLPTAHLRPAPLTVCCQMHDIYNASHLIFLPSSPRPLSNHPCPSPAQVQSQLHSFNCHNHYYCKFKGPSHTSVSLVHPSPSHLTS